MGTFDNIHDRAQERKDTARQNAESEATEEGASSEEVDAAGDSAARKQGVKNVFRGVMGPGADPK